ncbi:hypothetical protein M885DRAFT_505453 [Pelagophyceae sp. CCMP2097]|nr:hypothetical protein M885DRAFT_505453 [Pelagophyceae sp. CCMP2097]
MRLLVLVALAMARGSASLAARPMVSRSRRQAPRGRAAAGSSATERLTQLTCVAALAQVAFPRLTLLGAKQTSAVVAGEWWRLVTPVLLHSSVPHLLTNLYSLRNIGPQLEAAYGPKRLAVVYVAAGVAGNLLSCVMNPTGYSVGASGAIAGLVGALAVHLLRHQALLGDRATNGLQSIGRVIALNALIGVGSGTNIDNAGHLGGLLGGAATAYLVGARWQKVNTYGGPRIVDMPLIRLD